MTSQRDYRPFPDPAPPGQVLAVWTALVASSVVVWLGLCLVVVEVLG